MTTKSLNKTFLYIKKNVKIIERRKVAHKNAFIAQ